MRVKAELSGSTHLVTYQKLILFVKRKLLSTERDFYTWNQQVFLKLLFERNKGQKWAEKV